MSEPINNVIDVEVTISSAGLGGADLGVPCFFYGNAVDDTETGFNEFYRPSEVREKFPDKTDLAKQVTDWFSVSNQPVLTFGYKRIQSPLITTPLGTQIAVIGDIITFTVEAINTTTYTWYIDDVIQPDENTNSLIIDTTDMVENDYAVKVICSNEGSQKAESTGTLSVYVSTQDASAAQQALEEQQQQPQEPLSNEPSSAQQALLDELAAVKVSEAPDNLIDALDTAAASRWFYRPFITERVSELSVSELTDFSDWCEANSRRCDYTTGDDTVLDPNTIDDLISSMKLNSNRRTSIAFSKLTPTLSVRAGSYMSKTDYYALNGYIDAEFKKVGAAPEALSPTQISIIKAKGGYYNVSVQSLASESMGMLRHTKTCSPYNESIAQVEAIDAYLLGLQTELFNVVTSQDNFPQTYEGQTLLIDTADSFSDLFTTTKGNGFLGTRTVEHPVTGKSVVTEGYLNITKPEDIDKLTQEQRANNEAAPIVLYLYPSGSIWAVRVKVNVIY